MDISATIIIMSKRAAFHECDTFISRGGQAYSGPKYTRQKNMLDFLVVSMSRCSVVSVVSVVSNVSAAFFGCKASTSHLPVTRELSSAKNTASILLNFFGKLFVNILISVLLNSEKLP